MDPSLISAGLEISFCFANMIGSTSPSFASKDKPIPLICYMIYCILGLSVLSTFARDPKKQINIEKSIASLIDASEMTKSVLPYNSYSSRGNPLLAFRSNLRSYDQSGMAIGGGGHQTTDSEGDFIIEGRNRKRMGGGGNKRGPLSIRSYINEQPNYVTDYEIMGNTA